MSTLRITSIEEEPVAGRRPDDLGPVTFERLAPGGARWHPYADLFPWIEGPALAEFNADIAANGVRQPIVFLDGQILDGRNRYMAARQAGIEYPRCDYVGADPLGFVVSHNLRGRRHLTESQRAMVAAKLANLGVGRPAAAAVLETDGGANPPIGGISTEAAAKALNVGERSIERAKTVREHGTPELVAAVERGDAAVAAAEAIARLPQARQEEILAQVAASPEGKRAFAKVAKEAHRERQETKKNARAVREEILGMRQARLPQAKFGVILADPEWRFEPRSRASGMDRAADNHYPTSSLEVIKSRDVPSIAADDCVLFLWATAPMLPQALEVMAAWGFTYRSHQVWRKAQAGVLVYGTGYWFRNAHELVLVGTRGNVPAPAMGTQPASIFDAPPRKHSQKPGDVHAMIEAMFPTLPKIELNAREAREGWSAWGNEAPEEAAAPRVVGRDRHIEILRDIARGHRSGMHDPADPDVGALIAAGEISVSKGHRGRILAPGIAKLEELDGAAAEEAAATSEPKKPRAKKEPKKDEWQLRRERIASRAEAILAATRGDLDEIIADYRETLAAGHAAALAGDDEAWRASCERREALVLAANGGDQFGAAVNERPTALLAACRGEPGVAPLWGQAGVFRLEVDGVPVLVDVGSRWGSSIDVGLHAMSFGHKFPSETGYRSIPSLWPAEGTTIDEAVAIGFRGLLKEKPSEGLPPGPYYPENVYAPMADGRLSMRRRGVPIDPESPPPGYDWPAIFALFQAWRDSWGRGRPKAGERRFPKSTHRGTLIIDLDGSELRPVAEFPTSGAYVFDHQGIPANRYRLVRDGAFPEGPAE